MNAANRIITIAFIGLPQKFISLDRYRWSLWQAREASPDGKRRRRPFDDLPRLGIFAGGKLDEEAAVEHVGAGARGGLEISGGSISWSAAQRPLPFREQDRKHEACPWTDPTFAVGLEQEIPAFGAEFEVVLSDHLDPGARARVVEPQLAATK